MSVAKLRDERAGLVEAAEKVRTTLAELESRSEEVRSELAELTVSGDPDGRADALREERRELERDRAELEDLLPVLDERLRAATADLHEAAGCEAIQSVRKIAGGLAGEHPRHVARAEEHERQAEESRRKAEEAARRGKMLASAGAAVGRLLGVEVGEIRTVPGRRGGRSSLGRLLGRGELRKAGASAIRVLDKEGLLTEELREALEAAMAELDDEEEARRRRALDRERNEAQAEEQQEARDRVDAALRERLRDGPQPRDRIARWAKGQGIPVSRDPHDADLAAARRRLELVVVEQVGDPNRRPWWMLPDRAVPEGFRAPEGGFRAAEIR